MVLVFTIAGGLDLIYNRSFKKDSNVLQNEWAKAKEEIANKRKIIDQLDDVSQSDKLELTSSNESLKNNLQTLYNNVDGLKNECLKDLNSESCKHNLKMFKQAYDEALDDSNKITEI